MDGLLSIEQVMRTADMYNHLKPFKVFGLTARGALVMSVITMSLSFYSLVFSMYSQSASSSSAVGMLNSSQ